MAGRKPTTTKTQANREELYGVVAKKLPMFFGPTLPNMANFTPQGILDDVGDYKAMEADLKKIISLLNGIIDSKLSPEEQLKISEDMGYTLRGETYELYLHEVSQNRLDPELARQQLYRLAQKCGEDPQTILASVHRESTSVHHNYSEI